MAKGTGVLEANPAALAVVILFFLVITLGFEWILHWARNALIRRKKFGLLAALNNFASEIMLLGLASLLLMAVEDKLVTKCYKGDITPSLKPWLSQVQGCACCLHKTAGVSECFYKNKQCASFDEREKICTDNGILKGLEHDSKFSQADPSKMVPVAEGYKAGSTDKAGGAPAKNASTAPAATNATNGTNSSNVTEHGSNSSSNNATQQPVAPSSPLPSPAAPSPPPASTSPSPSPASTSPSPASASPTPQPQPQPSFVPPVTPTTPPANNISGSGLYVPQGRRRLMAPAAKEGGEKKEVECNGPFQLTYEECGNKQGIVPIVTIATLHQVHMLLFVVACVHILVSVLVLLIAATKLKYYARRGGSPKEDKLAAAARGIAAAKVNAGLHLQGSSSSKSGAVAAAQAAAFGGGGGSNSDHLPARDSMLEPVSPFAAPGGGTAAAAAAGGTGSGTGGAAPGSMAAGGAQELVAPSWNGRPWEMKTFLDYVIELLVHIYRQVALLNTVSRQEYSVLRATFYHTHGPSLARPVDHHAEHHDGHGGGHDAHGGGGGSSGGHHGGAPLHPDQAGGTYAPYVLESVERDGSRVVGLGVSMWVFLLLFVLVSGATGWAAWWFLILAASLLLFVNTILLASLRHMTRGGRVLAQKETWYQWLHQSRFLLGSIKLTLFFFTFAISNTIFMAGYFGPESCFFSRTGFQKRNPVPWWVILLVDVCLLMNLALYTLPMYSLTTHTLKCDQALFQSVVRDELEQKEWRLFKETCGRLGSKKRSALGSKSSKWETMQMATSV